MYINVNVCTIKSSYILFTTAKLCTAKKTPRNVSFKSYELIIAADLVSAILYMI